MKPLAEDSTWAGRQPWLRLSSGYGPDGKDAQIFVGSIRTQRGRVLAGRSRNPRFRCSPGNLHPCVVGHDHGLSRAEFPDRQTHRTSVALVSPRSAWWRSPTLRISPVTVLRRWAREHQLHAATGQTCRSQYPADGPKTPHIWGVLGPSAEFMEAPRIELGSLVVVRWCLQV